MIILRYVLRTYNISYMYNIYIYLHTFFHQLFSRLLYVFCMRMAGINLDGETKCLFDMGFCFGNLLELSCAGHTDQLAFLFSDSSVIDQGTVVKNPEGFSSRGWA